MRPRLATLLRRLADWLHPEYEITVYVRPVLVGEDEMRRTLGIFTQLERQRLDLPDAHRIEVRRW